LRILYNAWLHPHSTSAEFSWQAALFQFVFISIITAFLIIPLRKWGSKLVDGISIPDVWVSIMSVSLIFFMLNIAIVPRNYSTLYVGRILLLSHLCF